MGLLSYTPAARYCGMLTEPTQNMTCAKKYNQTSLLNEFVRVTNIVVLPLSYSLSDLANITQAPADSHVVPSPGETDTEETMTYSAFSTRDSAAG